MSTATSERTTDKKVAVRHLWTADEYLRAWESGVFAPGLRTELIDGEVFDRGAQGAEHILAVMNGNEALRATFGEIGHVRVQMTLRLSRRAVPEPDLLVVRGPVRGARAVPAVEDILLVVELSDWTLSEDRRAKARLYAGAGIGEYWIVNLRERRVEVHRQPGGQSYAEVRVFAEGESLQPLAAPPTSPPLPVADLLPAPGEAEAASASG